MRALNLIGISLINVLASKKLLVNVENMNETSSGSDYSMAPRGKLDLILVTQSVTCRLLQRVQF